MPAFLWIPTGTNNSPEWIHQSSIQCALAVNAQAFRDLKASPWSPKGCACICTSKVLEHPFEHSRDVFLSTASMLCDAMTLSCCTVLQKS